MPKNFWAEKAKQLSPWECLGISSKATEAEIRSAYKSQALRHHPDKIDEAGGAEATARFQAIQAAYEYCMKNVNTTKWTTVEDAEEEQGPSECHSSPSDSASNTDRSAPKTPDSAPDDGNAASEIPDPFDEYIREFEDFLATEFADERLPAPTQQGPGANTSIPAHKRLAIFRAQTKALQERQARKTTRHELRMSKKTKRERAQAWKLLEEQLEAEVAQEVAAKQERIKLAQLGQRKVIRPGREATMKLAQELDVADEPEGYNRGANVTVDEVPDNWEDELDG
jgi:hypothetical protein